MKLLKAYGEEARVIGEIIDYKDKKVIIVSRTLPGGLCAPLPFAGEGIRPS